jgi:hypothetical protein
MRRLAPDINHAAAAGGVLYAERKEAREDALFSRELADTPFSITTYISVSLNFFFTDILRFWILGYQ